MGAGLTWHNEHTLFPKAEEPIMSSTQDSEGAIELALLTSTSFVSSRGKPDY